MDKQEIFPDGTVIDKWFYDINIPELSDLGKQYVLTDNNVLDDGKINALNSTIIRLKEITRLPPQIQRAK